VRTYLAVIAAALSLLFITVPAVSPSPPVIVGMSASMSGDYSSNGAMFEKGVRLWLDDVNARGGILGRQVELLLKDDESNLAKAAQLYSMMASPQGADLILGPDHGRLALGILPALVKADVPAVFPVSAPDILWKSGKGLAFGVQAPLSDWPSGYFEVLSRSGVETVGILVVVHPMSEEVMENVTRITRRFSMRVTAKVATGLKGLPEAVSQIEKAKPDALTIWGSQEGCTEALKNLNRSGYRPKSLYVSTGQGTNAMLREFSARELEGVFTTAPWDARIAGAYPGGERFVERFRAAYGQDPDYLAASVYAGGQIFEAAAAKAQSLDPGKIRQALAGLETMTILGRYGVDPSGMQLRQFPVTMQWQKGKREIVWPEKLRTAKPVSPR